LKQFFHIFHPSFYYPFFLHLSLSFFSFTFLCPFPLPPTHICSPKWHRLIFPGEGGGGRVRRIWTPGPC
jgi:hypothetical protein